MWYEFSLTVQHVMYNEPLKLNSVVVGDANEIVVSHVPTVDSMHVDLPELNFILDAEQFFTTVDVIRNVLLAPPPPKRNYELEMKGAGGGVGGGSGYGGEQIRASSVTSLRDIDELALGGIPLPLPILRNESNASAATTTSGSGSTATARERRESGLKRRAESRRASNPSSTIHSHSPRVGNNSPMSKTNSSSPTPTVHDDQSQSSDPIISNNSNSNSNKSRKSSITGAVKEMLEKTKVSERANERKLHY